MIHRSDLEKLQDALEHAVRHQKSRDEMNAAQHLNAVRYSPLTSLLEAELQRVYRLLEEYDAEHGVKEKAEEVRLLLEKLTPEELERLLAAATPVVVEEDEGE